LAVVIIFAISVATVAKLPDVTALATVAKFPEDIAPATVEILFVGLI
jgi:hypothetical protein